MKIVVLTGSPHKAGTSFLLADNFIKGAKASGNDIFRFDAAFESIHPCIACDKCKCGENPCVFQDSMTNLYPRLIEADLIAFVTPLYYYGASAQIKAVIDRFYGIDGLIRNTGKKAVLFVTAGDTKEQIMNGVVGTYKGMLHYLNWQDCGKVLAIDSYTREDIEKTDYPQQAYQLGKNL